ncbi:kinase-like domain-containing protein [Syncephalis pseudoplumigaleata]|uniref:Kinase-like domain-containing protein n=1 Tax=Syncephalis pseudoplumigaleata TaxID=1712513 RepID=A0A4P9YXP1_9FUNG|nr:kinase-like domain-containing protein [Syncephalis pseudoplumigaleata]|eukprot:RKP23730.1 kinase-like domain-containing protein [Syncephalis pseudoplumigaleata]
MIFTPFAIALALCSMAAILHVQQVLATPFNVPFRRNSNGNAGLIALPTAQEIMSVEPGLRVDAVIGRGKYSMLGHATYNGKERLIKCSYRSFLGKTKQIYEQIAQRKQAYPTDSGYILKTLASFERPLANPATPRRSNSLTNALKLRSRASTVSCALYDYTNAMTLKTYSEKEAFKTQDVAIALIYQMLKALRFLHDNNIVYHDINPENIIIMQDTNGKPYIRLVDFDMCELLDSVASKPVPKGPYRGTSQAYIPPMAVMKRKHELFRGATWTAGAMFYHLLSGRAVSGQILDKDHPLATDTLKKSLKNVEGFAIPPLLSYPDASPFPDLLARLILALLPDALEHLYAPSEFLREYGSLEKLPKMRI